MIMELEIWILVENIYGLTEDVKTFLIRDHAVVEMNARMTKHYREWNHDFAKKSLWEGIDSVECNNCHEYIITLHMDEIELIDDRIG